MARQTRVLQTKDKIDGLDMEGNDENAHVSLPQRAIPVIENLISHIHRSVIEKGFCALEMPNADDDYIERFMTLLEEFGYVCYVTESGLFVEYRGRTE